MVRILTRGLAPNTASHLRRFACFGVAPLDRIHPGLAQSGDISVSQWVRAPSVLAADPMLNLWITAGNVTSGLHYDDTYNSLTVLKGAANPLLTDYHLSYQTAFAVCCRV